MDDPRTLHASEQKIMQRQISDLEGRLLQSRALIDRALTRLALAQAASGEAEDGLAFAAGPAAAGQKRILVVDDDPTIRRLVADLLHNEGYEVLQAPDGAAGVALAEAHRPDLILLDLAMPRTSGLEVLENLRRNDPTREIPVIVVSAYAPLLSADLRAGATSVLQKPFAVDALLEEVEQVVSERAQVIERQPA